MPEFFGASLPPGPFRDAIAQLCEEYRVEYRISADIGQITNFFHYIEDREKNRASDRVHIYPIDNCVPLTSEGHQRLTSGRDLEKSNGTGPFGAPKAPSRLQNAVEGSNINCNYSSMQPEPTALNAVDILMGTASRQEGPCMMLFSENAGHGAVVKKEEQETSPLVIQNVRPPLQSIYTLFSDGYDAQVKKEVDDDGCYDFGAVEGLVKQEPLDEDDCESGAGMQGEEMNSEETRQDLPLVLQSDVLPDGRGLFECEFCNFISRMKHDLLKHWKNHPNCEDCGLRFEEAAHRTPPHSAQRV